MSRFRLIIFISCIVVLMIICNAVIYEAIAQIFAVTATLHLLLLGAALALGSGGFIASSILGSYYYNWFTRLSYLLSAVWVGSAIYLFFACTLYGLLLFFPIPSPNTVGELLLVCVLAVAVYGITNARRIRVTEIDVTLPHLPNEWHGRKAIWVSDLHLGQIHGPKFAARVVHRINSLSHDIIFIGGDLFDGTGAPDIHELVLPFKQLRAPLGTYYVTGNHEEFGDVSRFITAIKAQGITVLMDEIKEVEGLQLVGVDYHNASEKNRFKTILSSLTIDLNKPSILLKHEPKDLDVACDAGISLQISGHTHHGQQWPFRYIAEMVYKGFAYGLHSLGDMQVYTSSGTGTWGPPIRVGTKSEIVVFTFKG